ncbi:MAG: hypothetical protein ACYTEQ_22380 [Planctomycetota bacterium]|jgi:hypothetical protein
MPEEEFEKMTKPNEAQGKILESVHKTLLEALRHREQEIRMTQTEILKKRGTRDSENCENIDKLSTS